MIDQVALAVAKVEAEPRRTAMVRGSLPLSTGRIAYLELPPDATDEELLDIVLLITSQVRAGVVSVRPDAHPLWTPT